jgi:hypothetical protein
MKYLLVLCLVLAPVAAFAVEGFGDQNLNLPARFYINTHNSFGNVADGDSAPTYSVYEQSTNTPLIDDASMTILDATNTDGFYTAVFTPTEALGFAIGETYCLRIEAPVDTVTGADVTVFRVVEQLEARVEDSVSHRFDIVDEEIGQLTESGANFSPTVAFTTGSSGSGTTTANLATVNGVPHELLAAEEGATPLNATYTFTLPSGSTPTSFFMVAKASTEAVYGDAFTVEFYNNSTSTWIESQFNVNVANYTFFAEVLGSDFINGSHQVKVRFKAADPNQEQSLYIDQAVVNYVTPLPDVIDNGFAAVPGAIWGDNAAEDLLNVGEVFKDMTAQGAENIALFFNNDGLEATKTIRAVTTPKNIIIQAPQQ